MKHLKFYLLLLLLLIPASLPLLKPGFFATHDDVQVLRLQQMFLCLKNLSLPCRWAPDLGGGYGHPVFIYHPVLPYYLGAPLHFLGISFITITKLLFLTTLLFSTLFIFLLLVEFFSPLAALVGTTLYLYAPYHAVEVYVRGALTEAWGITFFPLILWTLYRYLKKPSSKFFFLSTLSLTGLYLSHNIMTLLFLPLAIIWSLIWLIHFKRPTHLFKLGLILALSFGLGAFFLLPAFFERNLVHFELLNEYYDFHNHFVTVRQLFLDRSWGFGGSRPGPEDAMSFQIGWPHWWIIPFSIIALWFSKKTKPIFYSGIFMLLIFFGSLINTHAKSVYFWEVFPIISFVQFPWRLLAFIFFALSFLAALFVNKIPQKIRPILSILVIALTLYFNQPYFRVDQYSPVFQDSQKLEGDDAKKQSMNSLLDYYPATASLPKAAAPKLPFSEGENVEIKNFVKNSHTWQFEYSATSAPTIIVPIFEFPNWQIRLDGMPYDHQVTKPDGLISLTLPEKEHQVTGRLVETPLRRFSTLISLISGVIFLYLLFRPRLSSRILN